MFEGKNIIHVLIYAGNIVRPYISYIIAFLAGWIGKRIYDVKLGNPVKMYFLIPDDERCKLDYVEQDENEHYVKVSILPRNSISQVLIWYKPRVNYYEDEHYFGFEGDLSTKPIITEYSNPFIRDDNLEISYYRDWHHDYHLRTGKNRIKDEVYVDGFKVKTSVEGEYESKVYVHTPSKLGRAKIKLIVTDKPSIKVFCYNYKEKKEKKHKKHEVKFAN